MCQQKISQVILTGMLAVGLAFGAYTEVTEAKDETKGKTAVVFSENARKSFSHTSTLLIS